MIFIRVIQSAENTLSRHELILFFDKKLVMSKAFYVKDKAIVLQRIVLAAFN
jgi:hypothetical protein